MEKKPAVYILSSGVRGTLYIGITAVLKRRIFQHRSKLVEGFTKDYNVQRLVWYEYHPTINSAISREKNLKKWKRLWKIKLIEKSNPDWEDLFDEI